MFIIFIIIIIIIIMYAVTMLVEQNFIKDILLVKIYIYHNKQ